MHLPKCVQLGYGVSPPLLFSPIKGERTIRSLLPPSRGEDEDGRETYFPPSREGDGKPTALTYITPPLIGQCAP